MFKVWVVTQWPFLFHLGVTHTSLTSHALEVRLGHLKYCKHGYFRWGKIWQKCWQDILLGGNFDDTTPISFIKAYGFYFRVGVIFAKKTKA